MKNNLDLKRDSEGLLVKKLNRYFWKKLFLFFFSLIFLLIILCLMIILFEQLFEHDRSTSRQISIYLLIPALILFSLLLVLTINEYRSFFSKKFYIIEGRSYLTINDIFENDNRLNILKGILNNPGIHHNELQRNCTLQKGQLQWHLNVLLKYNIIKKKRYGQYSVYFPITSSIEEIENLKNLIPKSKTTLVILNIIEDNPRINSSEISRILKLSRNTVKYHIDKLSEENLIKLIKNGRKIELYPI